MIRSLPFALLVFSITIAASAAGFDGCKGVMITRSKDFSQADISSDLAKAEKRVKEICKKSGPIEKNLKLYGKASASCLASSADEAAKRYASVYHEHIAKGCKDMQEALAEAKRLCGVRGSSIAQVNKGVKSLNLGAESEGQAADQKTAGSIYQAAGRIYGVTSAEAGAAKKKIYDRLPSRGDSKRGEYMRKGNETADTPAPELDKLSRELKSMLAEVAGSAESKKAKLGCQKTTALIDDITKTMKNNLYPNGKVAARAIERVESSDLEKKAEYESMLAKTLGNTKSAESMSEAYKHGYVPGKGSDITGTEDAVKGDLAGTEEVGELKPVTKEDMAKMQSEYNEQQLLMAKTREVCKKNDCSGPDAISAAIEEAKNVKEVPAGFVPKSILEVDHKQPLFVAPVEEKAVEVKPTTIQDLSAGLRKPASVEGEGRATPVVAQPEICFYDKWVWNGFSSGYVRTLGVRNPSGICVADTQ